MLSIILSRRDFREFDQIISLYTLEKGKVEVLARGVKKITSKNAAHLEPFSLVEAEIVPGKEISHLTKVVPENYFVNIRQDLQKSLAASFVVSLLDKVLHENEKDERIFFLLQDWLEFLNHLIIKSFNHQLLLDGFVVKLFQLLGFTPELNTCVVCNGALGKVQNDSKFYFQGGGVICAVCESQKAKEGEKMVNFPLELKKDLLILLNNEWHLINNLRFEKRNSEDGVQDEEQELHNLIFQYLQFHTERKINNWGTLIDTLAL